MIDARHDIRRRAGGSKKAEPERRVETGHQVGKRWNVWKIGRLQSGCLSERIDLPGFDLLFEAQRINDRYIDFALQKRLHRWDVALVGHVRHLNADKIGKILDAQMGRATDAARRVVELPGIGFAVGDEVREGFDRRPARMPISEPPSTTRATGVKLAAV